MAKLDEENSLPIYSFGEDEIYAAMVFSDLQVKHIRSMITNEYAEKNNLKFDPSNPTQFAFEHEYMRGRIEMLRYMLIVSDTKYLEFMAKLEGKGEQ